MAKAISKAFSKALHEVEEFGSSIKKPDLSALKGSGGLKKPGHLGKKADKFAFEILVRQVSRLPDGLDNAALFVVIKRHDKEWESKKAAAQGDKCKFGQQYSVTSTLYRRGKDKDYDLKKFDVKVKRADKKGSETIGKTTLALGAYVQAPGSFEAAANLKLRGGTAAGAVVELEVRSRWLGEGSEADGSEATTSRRSSLDGGDSDGDGGRGRGKGKGAAGLGAIGEEEDDGGYRFDDEDDESAALNRRFGGRAATPERGGSREADDGRNLWREAAGGGRSGRRSADPRVRRLVECAVTREDVPRQWSGGSPQSAATIYRCFVRWMAGGEYAVEDVAGPLCDAVQDLLEAARELKILAFWIANLVALIVMLRKAPLARERGGGGGGRHGAQIKALGKEMKGAAKEMTGAAKAKMKKLKEKAAKMLRESDEDEEEDGGGRGKKGKGKKGKKKKDEEEEEEEERDEDEDEEDDGYRKKKKKGAGRKGRGSSSSEESRGRRTPSEASTSGSGSEGEGGVPESDVISFSARVTATLHAVYGSFLKAAYQTLNPLLSPAFLEPATIRAVTAAPPKKSKKKKQPASTESLLGGAEAGPPPPPTPRDVCRALDAVLAALEWAKLPPSVARQVLSQVAYFVDASLFNALLSRPDLCTVRSALTVKYALSLYEEWAHGSGRLAGPAAMRTVHVREALDVLCIVKENLAENAVRQVVCPHLTAAQLETLLRMFRPDDLSPNPVPEDVLRKVGRFASASEDMQAVQLDAYLRKPLELAASDCAVAGDPERIPALESLARERDFAFLSGRD